MKTWYFPFFHGLKLEISPLLSIQIFIGKCRKDIFRCLYEFLQCLRASVIAFHSDAHSSEDILFKILYDDIIRQELIIDFKLRYDIRAQIL